MAEQIGEHLGAYPQIDLARGIRVAQHMAAKVRRVQPGRLACLIRIWRIDDEAFSGWKGIFMRTNTCLVGVFGGRPLRR